MALLPAERAGASSTSRVRRVFDAGGRELLPGALVLDESHPGLISYDMHALEAYEACGATHDFLARVFLRNSIDNRGMAIESTVHFGHRYANACWNGRQMIFGDGDGRLFGRFTPAVDVAHELMHGVVQYSARLPYAGQPGAIAEHLADAFGIMARQYTNRETAAQSDWFIGAGLFGPEIRGIAIRSMLMPGTAYDDPWLGRDPQPAHMSDYVTFLADNGGVHVNSGIPNRAFALAARELGGYTWTVLGRIWYRVLTAKLAPETNFRSFARSTVEAAAELYRTPRVQQTIADAWAQVGLPVSAKSRNRLSLNSTTTTDKRRTDS